MIGLLFLLVITLILFRIFRPCIGKNSNTKTVDKNTDTKKVRIVKQIDDTYDVEVLERRYNWSRELGPRPYQEWIRYESFKTIQEAEYYATVTLKKKPEVIKEFEI